MSMTGNEPRLRARKVSKSSVDRSAQCRSSKIKTTRVRLRKPSQERQNRLEEARLLAYALIGGPGSVIGQEADQLCAVQPSGLVRSECSAQLAQHRGQRQVGHDSLAQLETGTDEDARVRYPPRELADQTGLADSGLAAEQDDCRRCLRCAKDVEEVSKLVRATDEC